MESFSAILAGVQNERISAYRIGGDEFCVILEKTNAVEIHQILDSLERKINDMILSMMMEIMTGTDIRKIRTMLMV
ncbi:diguanylate cyclase [Eubacterium sp. AM46-8]|uniref:diguanylate cyclase n=1 Tax=Eubacterium sp. AM46-8 TaxID=2292350 RepID=UPI000E4D83F9|nr:diguanylate cyclase [Eubacterium sp. AM46-8]